MDRRTITAIILSVAVYYLWMITITPIEPPVTEEEIPAPTEAPVIATQKEEINSAPEARALIEEVQEEALEVVPPPPTKSLPFEACGTIGVVSTEGGLFQSLKATAYDEPYIVTPIYSWLWNKTKGEESPFEPYQRPEGFASLLSEHAQILSAGSGEVSASLPVYRGETETLEEIYLEGMTTDGIQVSKRLSISPSEPCVMDVEQTWRNTNSQPFLGGLWFGMHDELDEAAGGMFGYLESSRQAWAMTGDDVDIRSRPEEYLESEALEGPIKWFGVADRYFSVVVVPESDQGELVFSGIKKDESELFGYHWLYGDPLQPGELVRAKFRLYAGEKDLSVLGGVDEDLTGLVQLGWFGMFARPLLWLLKWIYGFVGNWGLSILGLTFMVKMLFFPLTQTAFKSSQAMSALQPRMKELKELYSNDKETLNREMLSLFKENKVNPMGGCLPMVIQFPVWIALYRVLLSSVEIYQSEFLYLKDLSATDPYGIFPLVVMVLMLVQQQFTPMGNMDPAQARMMKLMPIMFGAFFFIFPAGLVLYILMNTVLTILQQYWIRRTFDKSGELTVEQAAT